MSLNQTFSTILSAFRSGKTGDVPLPSTITLGYFDKVILCPHIEATFIAGETSSISVEAMQVPAAKFKTELKDNTLFIFLEGMKAEVGFDKESPAQWKPGQSAYRGTAAKITVCYQHVDKLILIGDEKVDFLTPLQADDFFLKLLGNVKVSLAGVEANAMTTAVIGNSRLEVKGGAIDRQHIVAMGGGLINLEKVDTNQAALKVVGAYEIRLLVQQQLDIHALGNSKVFYRGNPCLNKGLMAGNTILRQLPG